MSLEILNFWLWSGFSSASFSWWNCAYKLLNMPCAVFRERPASYNFSTFFQLLCHFKKYLLPALFFYQIYYILNSCSSSSLSLDLLWQVGACIVALDNRVVGFGYNDMPPDGTQRWEKTSHDEMETKYPYGMFILTPSSAILNSGLQLPHFRAL